MFAWGFFCVALAPVLGFVDVGFMQYSLVADHYQHIAIIGVIALASAGFVAWRKRTQGLVRTGRARRGRCGGRDSYVSDLSAKRMLP